MSRKRWRQQELVQDEAALGSTRGAGRKCLYDLCYHQPYDGPYETAQMFFNGKTSDLGNIPWRREMNWQMEGYSDKGVFINIT